MFNRWLARLACSVTSVNIVLVFAQGSSIQRLPNRWALCSFKSLLTTYHLQTKEPSTNMPLEEPRPSLSPVSVPQTSPAKPTWEYPFASQRKPRDSASQSSQSNLPHPYQITADGSGLQPTSSSQQLEQLCELHEQRQALKPSPDKSGVARSCVEDPLQSESGQEGFCVVAEAARRAEKDTMMRNMSEIAL